MDTTNDELWRVQLSTGETRSMTLDALDQAFDEGLIDADAPVLPPGADVWTTLGRAAGLDDCPTVPTEPPASLSPHAISSPLSSPATLAASALQPDLDLPETFDELEPRGRRRNIMIGGVALTAALGAAVALLAGDLGSSMPVDVKATAVEAPPPALETLPAPAPATTDDAKDKPRLSDWQKRMLLDADKAREDKRTDSKAQTGKASKPKPAKTNTGLLNGGDKFDPLNGAL